MNALHERSRAGLALRAAIVGLTIATGCIHFTLGSLLFTLNAIGYFVAAVAMVAPIAPAVRFRWFIRLGLIGYTATTIVAWFLFGARYDVAYLAKAIEVGLIGLLALEIRAYDGNPIRRIRQIFRPSIRA